MEIFSLRRGGEMCKMDFDLSSRLVVAATKNIVSLRGGERSSPTRQSPPEYFINPTGDCHASVRTGSQ